MINRSYLIIIFQSIVQLLLLLLYHATDNNEVFFRKRKRRRRREKRHSVDKTPLLEVERGNERLTEDEQVQSGSVGFTTK